jgi:hypothetical protein
MTSKHIESLAYEIALLSNQSLGQLAQVLVAEYNDRADYLVMMINSEFQEKLMAYNERQAQRDNAVQTMIQDLIEAQHV